jgi:diguanylate cyclase (GGDEF)-like protein
VDKRPRRASDLSSLELQARIAALETTNEHLTRKVAELSFLWSAAARLGATLDRFEIAQAVLDCAAVAIERPRAHAFVLTRAGNAVAFIAGSSIEAHEAEAMVASHNDAIDRCLRVGAPSTVHEFTIVPIPGDAREPALGCIVLRASDGAFSAQVIKRLEKLAQLAGRSLGHARQLAFSIAAGTTDELTGVYNRRHFDRRLAEELRRARRLDERLTLILLDLDRFKEINDRFGHPEGDRALRTVAQCIVACVRDIDVVSRWGGDEFAIVIPGADGGEAVVVAERIHAAVRALDLGHGDDPLRPTVSCGVAWVSPKIHTPAQFVAAADRCLLEAKRTGRDRTVAMAGDAGAAFQGRSGDVDERPAREHRGAARNA